MGRKGDVRLGTSLDRDDLERGPESIGIRRDEPRVIEKDTDLLHNRGVRSDGDPSSLNIFSILAATRVGAVSRQHQGQHPPVPAFVNSCIASARNGCQLRLPQAIGSLMPLGQCGVEDTDQVANLVVQRTLAAKMIIVIGHGQEPLARDVATPRDVFQKGDHVFAALPARRNRRSGWRHTRWTNCFPDLERGDEKSLSRTLVSRWRGRELARERCGQNL